MTKPTLLALAGTLALGALVAAQEYPHAFPRTGTKQLFDNERITMWEVVWKQGVPQPVHRHRYDMAGVYLAYAPIRVTTPDGKFSPPGPPFEIPRPYYQPKDITHKEEAIGLPGDPERMAIMIDLKETSVTPFALKAGQERSYPREGAKDVLDNPRVRMWDYTWRIDKPTPMHVHDTDTIEVYVEGGTILRKNAAGKEDRMVVQPKTARFIPRGVVETEQAVDVSPRAIVIELKER